MFRFRNRSNLVRQTEAELLSALIGRWQIVDETNTTKNILEVPGVVSLKPKRTTSKKQIEQLLKSLGEEDDFSSTSEPMTAIYSVFGTTYDDFSDGSNEDDKDDDHLDDVGKLKQNADERQSHSSSTLNKKLSMVGTLLTLHEEGDVNWDFPKMSTFATGDQIDERETLQRDLCRFTTAVYSPTVSKLILTSETDAGIVEMPFTFTFENNFERLILDNAKCRWVCVKAFEASAAPTFLLSALREQLFTDMIITSMDNRVVKMHSFILQLRGPLLVAMLNSKDVKLPELSYEAWMCLLEFLYTDTISPSLAIHAETLLPVSKLLKLDDLHAACERSIRLDSLFLEILPCSKRIKANLTQALDCLHKHEGGIENVEGMEKTIIEALRHFACAMYDLLLIFHLYSKKSHLLPRDQRKVVFNHLFEPFSQFVTTLRTSVCIFRDFFNPLGGVNFSQIAPQYSSCLGKFLVLFDKISISCEKIGKVGFLASIQDDNEESAHGAQHSGGKKAAKSKTTKKGIKKRSFLSKLIALKLRNGPLFVLEDMLKFRKTVFSSLQAFSLVDQEALGYMLAEKFQLFASILDEFVAFPSRKLFKYLDKLLEVPRWKIAVRGLMVYVAGITSSLRRSGSDIHPMLEDLCVHLKQPELRALFTSLEILPRLSDEREKTEISASTNHATTDSILENREANSTLLADLERLYDSRKENGDMKFLLDEESIPAHRVIVTARCEWFKKAFSSGMLESSTYEIRVPDYSAQAFHVFLKYLYTGALDLLSFENAAVALLELSDRYLLNELISKCESFLCEHVDEENASDLITIAERYRLEKLREATLSFISKYLDYRDVKSFSSLSEKILSEIEKRQQVELQKQSNESNDENESHVGFHTDDFLELNTNIEDETLRWSSLGHNNDAVLENLPLMPQIADETLVQFRAIVGEEVSTADLRAYLVMADNDINRAVNFYYIQISNE